MKKRILSDKSRKTINNECFDFIFVQTALCIVLVILTIVFKSVLPETYSAIKSEYISAVSTTDVTLNDVKVFAFTLFDFVFSDGKSSGGKDSVSIEDVSTSAYVLTTDICPPTKGSVTSEFGYRIHPIFKTEGFHTGVDIAAARGTEIMASFSGEIYEVGVSEAYGNYILMKHSETLYTFYGHCDSIKAEKGMYMRQGEVIAYMGSTGYSTGPHLHFEIRIGGKRVDPLYVLRGFDEIAV